MPARRKPLDVKRLQGTDKCNKQPTGIQLTGTVDRPKWLSKEARRVWDHVAESLGDNLKSVDSYALSSFCVAAVRWQSAEQTIDEQGQFLEQPIVNRSTGNVIGTKIIPHPAIKIAKEAREAMLKSAALFGFDIRSRGSLDIPLPSAGDKFRRPTPMSVPAYDPAKYFSPEQLEQIAREQRQLDAEKERSK